MGWSGLDSRYKAMFLSVILVLGGASILVAIAMTFNWHLHRASVEEFMAKEDSKHQELIAAHEVDCPVRKGGIHHVTLTLEEIEARNVARLKRVELVEHAKQVLGDEWDQIDLRHFILYGEPLK